MPCLGQKIDQEVSISEVCTSKYLQMYVLNSNYSSLHKQYGLHILLDIWTAIMTDYSNKILDIYGNKNKTTIHKFSLCFLQTLVGDGDTIYIVKNYNTNIFHDIPILYVLYFWIYQAQPSIRRHAQIMKTPEGVRVLGKCIVYFITLD